MPDSEYFASYKLVNIQKPYELQKGKQGKSGLVLWVNSFCQS